MKPKQKGPSPIWFFLGLVVVVVFIVLCFLGCVSRATADSVTPPNPMLVKSPPRLKMPSVVKSLKPTIHSTAIPLDTGGISIISAQLVASSTNGARDELGNWSPAFSYTLTLKCLVPTNGPYVVEHKPQITDPKPISGGFSGRHWVKLLPVFTNVAGVNTMQIAVPCWDSAFYRVRSL